MRNEKLAYISIALLLILAASMFAVIPAKAFVHPDASSDKNFELYGPHLNQVIVKEYATTDDEWNALQLGDIDVTDWPLTPTWQTTFASNPNVIVMDAGGQNSYYVIDFNMDPYRYVPNSDRAPYANPVYNYISTDTAYPSGLAPITTNVFFRQACYNLFDRASYQVFLGASPEIYTPIPYYMSTLAIDWIWHGASSTYSKAAALANLALGRILNYTNTPTPGYTNGTWYWDYNNDKTPSPTEVQACVLEETYRSDANRKQAGQMLATALTNLGFAWKAGYPKMVTGTQNYNTVMLVKDYLITTLGWGSVGPMPDYLYAGYNSANFWDDPSSSCPNTGDCNDTIMDAESLGIHTAPNLTDAYNHCINWQVRFQAVCQEICLYSPACFMAESKYYVGPNEYKPAPGTGESNYINQTWLGIANEPAVGTDNWFTMLNAYPSCTLYQNDGLNNMTLRWGWEVQGYPQHLNPLYSEWVWDYDILGMMYDAPGYLDPYDLTNWRADLIKNWTVGTWTDPVTGATKSAVTLTLRPDVYWTDGVPVTMADVIFSIVQLGPLLVSRGMAPPWWWPTAETMQSVAVVDPYTVQLLFNIQSVWAEGWGVGGFYIIPEHIWKPLILSGTNMAQFAPDPNFIASGPYRFKFEDSAGTVLVMLANTPGSTVQTSLAGSVPITSPVGYHNFCPVYANVHTVTPDYQVRIPIVLTTDTPTVYFDVSLVNKLSNSSGVFTNLLAAKTVYLDGNNITNLNVPETLLAGEPSGPPVVEHFSAPLGIGLHTVTVTCVITGPANVCVGGTFGGPYANPWIGQVITATLRIYVTKTEDIGGSTFYDDIGWGNQTQKNEWSPPAPYKMEVPTPDFVVDGSDLSAAARAFGTMPGSTRWSPTADVNHDFVDDGSDLAQIARSFGW